jgi:hypothetical protein
MEDAMKGVLMLLGAAAGAWRRGLGGAVLGAGVGWAIGTLLTPLHSAAAETTAKEEHYVRYPEEEIVNALQEAGDELVAEGAELDDLYREVSVKG